MSQASSLFLVTTALLSSTSLAAQEPWQPGPPLFATERVHAAATVRGGTLYALGGTPWLNGADQDGSVHSLLPGGAAWVEELGLEGMGSVIGQGAGIDGLGRIVVFGGEILADGGAGKTKVWDPVEGPTTTLANLPDLAPMLYFAWCADAEGRLYHLGGGKGREAVPGEGNEASCWRYVASSNAWLTITNMPQGVGDAAGVYDGNGHVLVIGGVVADGGARTTNVAQFDIQTGTWSDSAVPDMPVAVSGARAVLGANGWIHVIGGEGGDLLEPTMLASTWIYHPDTQSWAAGSSLATSRRYHAAALGSDGFIYVLGGENENGPVTTCEKLFTPSCPTIVTQPRDARVWNAQSVGISAAVSGGAPFAFQWFQNGVALSDGALPGGASASGTRSLTLTLTNATPAIAGDYTLSASNACGATTSRAARLEIMQPPRIDGRWHATNLHPGWGEGSSAAGVWNGVQVGTNVLDVPSYNNVSQATTWLGSAASGTWYTGPGSVGGAFADIDAGLRVGWWWWPYQCYISGQWYTCYTQQASAVDLAGTFHNLQYSGWEYSQAAATDGIEIVGSATTDDASGNAYARAMLWRQNTGGGFSGIPLSDGYSDIAYASAVWDGKQYGSYSYRGVLYDGPHPCVWSGSGASRVEMTPTGTTGAWIAAAHLGQQGGSANWGDGSHAALWGGSADSAIDLHPAGYASSSIADIHSGVQVGGASVGSSTHAVVWNGVAASMVDLHAFLPPEFTSSSASGVDVRAGRVTVVGGGFNSLTGRSEALLWERFSFQPSPRPKGFAGSPVVLGTGPTVPVLLEPPAPALERLPGVR